MINPSDGSAAIEIKAEESLSKMVEISNDNASQLLRLNTIDETIEAVIANGNENSLNEMGTNNGNNNDTAM